MTEQSSNKKTHRKGAPEPHPDKPEEKNRRSSKTDRRQTVVDRRIGLERRRGPGRRRSDDRKAAEEGEMTDEQFDFVMAMDRYKRVNSRPFPTWTEVLDVLHALGYRKVAEPKDIE